MHSAICLGEPICRRFGTVAWEQLALDLADIVEHMGGAATSDPATQSLARAANDAPWSMAVAALAMSHNS